MNEYVTVFGYCVLGIIFFIGMVNCIVGIFKALDFDNETI